MRRFVAIAIMLLGSAALAGCGGTGMFMGQSPAPPRPVASLAPTVTADGTQQFSVPPEGRAVLRQRLAQVMQGRLEDARVSNAWRTAAGAKAKPDDYAACVSTVAGGQTRYFVIVVSGATTSGFIAGPDAVSRCSDPARVVQWTAFPEALDLG